jgi:hypothetical protein
MTSPRHPCDWAAVRAAYETSTESPVAIARRFGEHHLTVYGRARREGWCRFEGAEVPAADMTTPAPPPKPPRHKAPTKAGTHRRMVERLYSIIDAKLAQMETRMPGQDDQKSADHEREAKTIGTLISNIEKVQELDGDAGKSNKSVGANHFTSDEERVCRDLAERLIKRANRSEGPAGVPKGNAG